MSEKKIRILLIESNLRDARFIRGMLTDAAQTDPDIPSFDIVRAAKLSTGLKRLSKGDIDVVLLNLSLPDSQGPETFTKVHVQAPEAPVVILSNPEDRALAVDAVHLGAQDHLIKDQTNGDLLIRSIYYAVKCAQAEAIRQRTEETLRASERKFRMLYENAPLAYHSLDKDGRLIEVNQAWLDMLGYSRDQVIGRWFGDFLSPQHADDFEQSFSRFIATGTTRTEFEMVRKDGSHIAVSIDGQARHDEQGNFEQTHCILYNITDRVHSEEERTRAEEALRAERDFSKGVLDALADTVFVFDPETREALRWNSAFREITGYTDEEISSRKAPDDWYSDQDLEKTTAEIEKLSRGEKSVIEMALITKDGRRIPTEYSAAMIQDPQGGSPYIVAVGRDISERVRAEKALRIQRDLGVVLSSTSDLTEALHQVLEASLQMEEIDSGGVYLFDALTGGLDLAMHTELDAKFIESVSHYDANTPNTQLILAGEPIYAHRADLPPDRREILQREGLRALAIIPVMYEGHAIASFNLASHVYDEIPINTRHALEAIGTQVGGVIARLEAVQALQASEERYRIVSTLTSDIAYAVEVEPDGTAIPEWVTGALVRITGFTVNDLVARGGWPSLLHPDDLPLAFKHLQVHLTGQPEVAEYRIITKSGEVRWLRDYGYPIWDEAECRVVRIIGAAQDITERKQAEEALRENRRRLQAIFDQTFQFMGLMTPDGILTEVNQTALDFAGLAESDVIGKPFWETPWWTHSPELQEQLRDAVSRAASGEFVRFEANHLAADGSLHYIDFSLKPVRDETGNVSFLIPEGRDTTERKQAEKALRESEERHRLISELTTDYIFRLDIDADGNAVMSMVSESFFATTGRTLEEAKTPALWTSIFHPDDLEKTMEFFQAAVSSGQPGEIECRTYVKSGRQRWVQILAQPMWDEKEQRTVAILGAVKDITQRKQAEEQIEHLNHLQGDLLSPHSLTEKLNLITEGIVSIFDADFARIWAIQPGDLCDSGCIHARVTKGPHVCQYRDRCLHLLSSSGRYTHVDGEMHRRVPFGCYKIGRVASGEDPKFVTNDVTHDPRVHDHEWARELGLTSFAGYRLKSTTGEVVGVLALFSKHAISPSEDALIEGLANTTAQVIQTFQAEDALEKSEATLRSIFRVAPVGIGLVKNRVFQWTNETFNQMLGYSGEELKGQSARMVYPSQEEYEQVGREKYIEIADRGTASIETRFRRKDGEIIDVLLNSTPIDPADPSIGVTFTALDITERKQVEEALRESGEKYRELANSITDVFFAVDKELRYTYWNTASEQLTGLTAKDTLGRSIKEVFPESTKKLVQAYEKILRTQKPQAFVTDYLLAGAGFFEISAYPSKDGISVFAKDITERVRSEQERAQAEEERERLLEQIQEQARRVQQIIDTVPEGVILLDANARIVLANPLGRKDLTVLADTLVGGILTRLSDRPLAEILTSPPHGLWHEITAEGYDFQVIARPVSEATETGPTHSGWVLVIRDVTQQREGERRIQQQERLAAVGQLAAGIAHDFNNIMAVITLYAGMSLRTPDVPQNVYERLEVINQQAQRASDLIQQIMDFSRRAVLERGPLDLLAFMKEQVKLLQRTLPESIKIDLNYGKDEYTIWADLTRIQQVIMNLATNARDAMPLGGELKITLERVRLEKNDTPPIPEMEAGEWVCVQVTDSGSGIADDARPHIFNPFFTTKEPGKGTGLGLAQVYGIIRQHGGYINFRTQIRKGTTFILYLPALSTADSSEISTAAKDQLPQGKGQTILVVEDDAATRAAVVGSLELLGYQILEATNGQEALSIYKQHTDQADHPGRIALVLSDLVMPEMGGQVLFYALKRQKSDVKVLLLTGHPLEEEGLEALRAQGLKGWLPKPPSLERLAKVVAQVLEEE